MKKAMIKKVTAFLIAGTMLIIVVPSHNKVTAEAKVNSINYDFLNNEPGMASGKITISTTRLTERNVNINPCFIILHFLILP